MKQYSFAFTTLDSLYDEIEKVKINPENPQAPVIHVFTSTRSCDMVEEIMDCLKKTFPRCLIAGMSTSGVPWNGKIRSNLSIVTLMEFQDTRIRTCHIPSETKDAGRSLYHSLLSRCSHPVGLEVLAASLYDGTMDYSKTFKGTDPLLPVFSAHGSTCTPDDSPFLFDRDHIYWDGCLLLLYDGSVVIDMNSILGWTPLGQSARVTGVKNGHILQTLDGKPAVWLYRKYLQVNADAYFLNKAAAFPLLLMRDGAPVARIPWGLGPSGELLLSGDCRQGDIIHLSYESPNKIRKAARDALTLAQNFNPEGLLLFSSSIRTMVLKESMNMPLAVLEHIHQAAGGCSWGEIAGTTEHADSMDMTSLLVLFREGGNEKPRCPKKAAPPILRGHNKAVLPGDPLSTIRHLASFIEMTSKELEESYRKMAYIATHDGLTNILNRGTIEKILADSLAALSDDQPLNAIMIDVDHFKGINDSYGHIIGDRVLTAISHILASRLRSNDYVGRWGGDEFVILLPGVSLEDARKIAERLRLAICEADILPDKARVTASFGVAKALPGENIDLFYQRMDKALYMAKNEGKNKVTILK